ncbi:unnamed protein product [Owenia fusiformis]|uniref:F5/8 type C domain-containing protein n=1 Tax=Owenia fusiformis TaxID=6347 RepID=A0A8S4NNS6_OWEFU|nr:unnamed protein product [Owenia fusiformis]
MKSAIFLFAVLVIVRYETNSAALAGGVDFSSPPLKTENIALNKPTSQSSTYITGHASAESYKAVDGSDDRDWYHGSCTHTQNDVNAWWMVDLEGEYLVQSVRLVNNMNTVPARLANFKIEVSKDKITWELCAHHGSTLNSVNMDWQLFDCPALMIGRYVRVQLQGTNYLILCEVEVNGRRSITN